MNQQTNPKSENDAQEFFEARAPWSKVKHEVLSRYLDVYVSKVGAFEERLFYVDGFAGCGLYADGAVGSPLIAAMKASKPITHSRAGKLRCVFVEDDPANLASLEAAMKSQFPDVATKVLPGKFDANLPAILQNVGNCPAFYFIDPFGFQSVDLELLRKIRQASNQKSEVLLRFDDIYLKRMGAFAEKHSQNTNSPSIRKTAKTFASKCNAVLGKTTICDATREELAATYCELIKAEGLYRFAISYPVKNPETKGHHYYLVHLCNFEDGYVHMADFMGQIERSIDHRNTTMFPELETDHSPSFGIILDSALKEQDRAVEKDNTDRVLRFFRSQPTARWQNFAPLQRRHFLAAAVDQFGYQIRMKEAQKAVTAWLAETGGHSEGPKESSAVTIRNP